MNKENSNSNAEHKALNDELHVLRDRVRKLEEQLAAKTVDAQNLELLTALMDHIPDNIYFKDVDSRFTLINAAMARYLKLSHPSEAIGKSDFDFFTSEHAQRAYKDERKVLKSGEPIKGLEERETWAGQKDSWVSTTKMPLRDKSGKIVGTFGISRDITRRKQVEQQLEESEARFRAVIQLAPDIIYRIDPAGRIVFISDAVEMLGYKPDELLGRPFEELVWPEDAVSLRNHLVEHRIGARATHDLELRLCRKGPKGRRRKQDCLVVSISARGLWSVPDDRIGTARKTFLGTEGIIHDITERKRVEAELVSHREHLEELVAERTAELKTANARLTSEVDVRKQAEDALRRERDKAQLYLDIAGAIIVVLNEDGNVTLINRRGCEILGYPEKEILGKSWFDSFLPADTRGDVRRSYRKLLAGQLEQAEYHENDIVAKGGELRRIAWHNSLLHDDEGRIVGTLSSGEDVTERRRTEDALLQSERLEAIGAMAGGAALRFNGLVNAISGCASAILSNSMPHTSAHDESLKILDSTRQAADLTHRLLAVSNASSLPAENGSDVVSLGEVVRSAVDFLEQSFAEKGIRIHVHDTSAMPHAHGTAAPLLDVLMAILVNAGEAMPDGGRVTLETREMKVEKPNIKLNPKARPGRYVALRVKDTGVGISKEQRNRIFEPFFTTKKLGSSFGLGLPFALNVVRRMGGWIAIRSKPGLGTTVEIILPVAERARSAGRSAAQRRAEMRHAILLVDDRAADLAAMKRALGHAGFDVMEAISAAEAAVELDRHRKRTAIAVVDATLGGDGCAALLAELERSDSRIPVILTSGFSREFVRSVVPPGAWGFLQKPFDDRQLVDAVNDVLRQSRLHAAATGDARS